jgi:hypothetical protein
VSSTAPPPTASAGSTSPGADAVGGPADTWALGDARFDAVVSGLVLNFVPDPWGPFLGGQGPAPGYATSLDEPGRAALREELRGRLPVAADGSMPLVARAWAVRGLS